MKRGMNSWIAFSALAYREISRFLRVWPQTLVPPVITVFLYFLVFGKVVGARMPDVGDVSYVLYIAPGLIMMQLLMSAYMNTSSSFYGAKFSRCIEEILVSPMSNFNIACGFVSGGVSRSFLVAFFAFCISEIFVPLHILHWVLLLYSAFITSVLFSSLGIINAIFAEKFDDISWIPSFLITPLTYLGGVFYSVSALPGIWSHVSLFDPIFYIINTFRYSMFGGHDFHIVISLVFVTVLAMFMFYMAVYLIKTSKRLRH